MVGRRYLVTGCAGFIASRVSEMLLDAGAEVVGMDDVNDAYDVRLKDWRLENLLNRERFTFHRVDVAERDDVFRIFAASDRDPAFDAVFDLAARAGVRRSVEDPWIYLRANAEGAINLLEACRRSRTPKFVLASTSSLYAGVETLPYSEDSPTDRPLAPYAASKKAAEAMAHAYYHLHRLDVTILRYFTVYGPFGRPDMSVFRFVRRIHEGEPITVFGDGSQSRDFTFVDDIARGTIAAARPLGFEIVNLGCDQPVVLMDMIRSIAQRVGRDPIIRYQPGHPADVPATWADIRKAARLLDWKPQVSLDEGLDRTVAWYLRCRDRALSIHLG